MPYNFGIWAAPIRQSIANITHLSTNLATTPCAFKFSATLLNFKLMDADTVFREKDSDPEIDDRMKTGFTNFLECLNLYLDLQSGITSVNESVVHKG